MSQMLQNSTLQLSFHGSSSSIPQKGASSSARSCSSCFCCALQQIFSVGPVHCISLHFFLHLDIAYLFSVLGCSVSHAPGLAKILPCVRATLPSALNVINASSVGKLVQLVTASRLTLYHGGQIDPMKDECHYQVKH